MISFLNERFITYIDILHRVIFKLGLLCNYLIFRCVTCMLIAVVKMKLAEPVALVVIFVCSILIPQSIACNDAVCASLVSKCLLLKSCECDMSNRSNCTCCVDCHRCLARLYTDCCSCVGKLNNSYNI